MTQVFFHRVRHVALHRTFNAICVVYSKHSFFFRLERRWGNITPRPLDAQQTGPLGKMPENIPVCVLKTHACHY